MVKRRRTNRIGFCSYHLHYPKKRTRLFRCKYCGELFCKEHIRPKPPGTPRFDSATSKDRLFMEEWHKPGGHPCTPYLNYWEKENVSKNDKWIETLDRMNASRSNRKPEVEEYSHKIPDDVRKIIEKFHRHIEDEQDTIKDRENISYPSKKTNIYLPRFFGKLWYIVKDSFFPFLKWLVISLVILVLLNIFFLKNIDFYSVIFRSLIVSLVIRIISFVHDETRYKVPWGWIILGVIVIAFAYMYSIHNFSLVGKSLDKITGIGNFTNRSISILKSFTKSAGGTIGEITSEVVSKPNTSDIELDILKYTNIERRNNGLKELVLDQSLSQIARSHSQDMAQNNFFSHINLNGEDPTARAKVAGYPLFKQLSNGFYTEGIGENIGKMPTGDVVGIGHVSNNADSIANAQVESWMESPGHRENILNSNYDKIGVGVAYDRTYYISTQDFW